MEMKFHLQILVSFMFFQFVVNNLNIVSANTPENCTFKTLTYSPLLQISNDFVEKITNLLSEGFTDTNEENYLSNSKKLLANQSEWIALIISKPPFMPILLTKNTENELNSISIAKNRTKETQWFWKFSDDGIRGWNVPFRDCFLTKGQWIHAYFIADSAAASMTVFTKLKMNRCDINLKELFDSDHLCDVKTTECVPIYETEIVGDYKCVCKANHFYPTAQTDWNGIKRKDIEKSSLSDLRNKCYLCPENCPECQTTSRCLFRPRLFVRRIILFVQIFFLVLVGVSSVVIFKHRKDKAIANSMWIMLETILIGIGFLYLDIVVHLLSGFNVVCILENWCREIGFILCYGSIYLKLFKHLTEFRTRKAHRWIIKNVDLLKYLTVMTAIMSAYMMSYSAFVTQLNFNEEFSLLKTSANSEQRYFSVCKLTLWNLSTTICEIVLLFFACRVCCIIRKAKIHEKENRFLITVVFNEFFMTIVFSIVQLAFYLTQYYDPDFVILLNFLRCHLSITPTFLLVFVPKFIYQIRYNKIKNETLNNENIQCSSNVINSDGESSAVSLSHVDPELVKSELKRLYHEIEVMREKCMQFDNPHLLSKKMGSKSVCRKFSIQNLKRKQSKMSFKHKDSECTLSPKNSVFSIEGP